VVRLRCLTQLIGLPAHDVTTFANFEAFERVGMAVLTANNNNQLIVSITSGEGGVEYLHLC
jgi:hypothetical protein